MPKLQQRSAPLMWSLALASVVSVGFFVGDVHMTGKYTYWYLVWNLFLAWLPLAFAGLLLKWLERHTWSSAVGIVLTALWLIFLPNSFYLASDFIHLGDAVSNADILYEAVMFLCFVASGMLVGFVSLYIVHRQLLKRLSTATSHAVVGLLILICSFAIYLGRDLRWNSWDAITNPAGVLFTVSDPFVNPRTHGLAFTMTLMFFVLIGTFYIVAWQLIEKPSSATGAKASP